MLKQASKMIHLVGVTSVEIFHKPVFAASVVGQGDLGKWIMVIGEISRAKWIDAADGVRRLVMPTNSCRIWV
jgi:hypothetical protein